MSKKYSYTKKQCKDWVEGGKKFYPDNKNRKLMYGKGPYKEISKACSYILQGTTKYEDKPLYSEEQCKKWLKSGMKYYPDNPRKKMTKNAKPYKHAIEVCSKYNIPESPKIISPKNTSINAKLKKYMEYMLDIFNGKIDIKNICDFDIIHIDDINSLTYMVTGSAEIVLFATLKLFPKNANIDIVIKAVEIGKINIPREKYLLEAKLYNITNLITMDGISPHTVFYLGKDMCDKNTQIFDIVEYNSKIKNKDSGVAMILLERVYKAKEISEFNDPIPKKLLSAFFFQTVYTICCYEQLGIQHNDTHDGNILISKLPEPVELNYVTDVNSNNTCTVYSMTTNIFIKIVDFGISLKVPTKYSSSSVSNDVFITNDDCKSICRCNKFVKKLDLFKFIFTMIGVQEITDAEKFVKNPKLNNIKLWEDVQYYPCIKKGKNYHYFNVTDSDIMSYSEIFDKVCNMYGIVKKKTVPLKTIEKNFYDYYMLPSVRSKFTPGWKLD